MLGMLVLLYLAWDFARQPSTWRWLAGDVGAEGADAQDIPGSPKRELDTAKPNAATAVPAKKPSPSEADKKGAAPQQSSVEADKKGVSPEQAIAETDKRGSAPEQPPAAESAAKGPTDEDPEEREGALNEFQAITDKTLDVQPEEMFVYKRMVQWVVNQPTAVLRKRAHTDLTFHDFMTSPDKHRGEIVELVLDARLIRSTQWHATDGTDLYEVWGFAADSGSWLYNAIVLGLPPGMPVGQRVNERVRFVGYFFKLQGYYEAGAKPRAAPLVAPLLIGRLIWIQAPSAPSTKSDATWTAIAIVGFALVVCLHFLWLFLRPKRSRSSMRPIGRPKPDALSMDQWLDKAEEDAAPINDVEDGHNEESPDVTRKPGPTGGNGEGTGEPYSHPLDGDDGGGG
jgi:hypothetical protein